MKDRLFAAGLVLALAVPVSAQAPAGQQPAQPAQPAQQDQQDPDRPITISEQVVVTASRSDQQIVNAPAAVSLVTSETIQNSPATNMGELLRAVPGLNVTQTSARDVNFTTRGATSTLATSQLALVDGRSIYLDFFGMIMWDLVPTNPHEIRQIEVVRGPASAVWGANAMTGVVNVITKTPRELAADAGRSVTLGLGGFTRDVTGRDADTGTLFYVNGSHAQAVDDRWSYKLSAGYFTQDPLPRPTGNLPSGLAYPNFMNTTGTSQPKFDARVDYELTGDARLTFAGGVAGTEGLIHTGIGPFDVDSDSRLGYFTTRYTKGGRRIAFFTNLLNGDAANLLTSDAAGNPIDLIFDTKTFDVEAGDVRTIGTSHVLSFGGNYRHNSFDISIAQSGDSRDEGGGYIQDEIFLGDRFRWIVGGRLDKFSSIDSAVFSPRTALLYKPLPEHTVRVSFNRAFRAPSHINNHLDLTVGTPIVLPVGPFLVATRAVGNPDLEEETLTAFEVGYTGQVADRATLSAAVYWNNTEDSIAFTPVAAYSAANPPPGWPLPPQFVPPGQLPSRFTYLNIGKVKDKGVELGVDTAVNPFVNAFVNYSYQWMPEIEDFAPGTGINDINWPAKNRFNAGFNFSYARFLGNLSVNYTDEAYWQDVLDARFAGTTDAFTMVNAGFGVRWLGERVVTSIKVTNLGNEEIQQHIFGDIMRRQVVGEVRVQF